MSKKLLDSKYVALISRAETARFFLDLMVHRAKPPGFMIQKPSADLTGAKRLPESRNPTKPGLSLKPGSLPGGALASSPTTPSGGKLARPGWLCSLPARVGSTKVWGATPDWGTQPVTLYWSLSLGPKVARGAEGSAGVGCCWGDSHGLAQPFQLPVAVGEGFGLVF